MRKTAFKNLKGFFIFTFKMNLIPTWQDGKMAFKHIHLYKLFISIQTLIY